ncbi:MAG: hypothetical protein ACTSQL_10395, partial [Promethearchaeota archaeon]
VNGMIRIQKYVADQLGLEMGHYVDFSNSLHIYGNTISDVKDMFTRMKNRGEEFPEDVIELLEQN